MCRRFCTILIIIAIIFIPVEINASSGCCSHHGGVDCSRKQANGRVICNDGWMGSSCYYSSMSKCIGYDIENDNNEKNNIVQNKDNKSSNNLIWWIVAIGCGGIFYARSKSSKNDYEVNNSNSNNEPLISDVDIEKIKMLNNAISNDKVIIIKYISSKNNITNRKIKPKLLYRNNNEIYVKAFCYWKKEERTFKISRIIEIKFM